MLAWHHTEMKGIQDIEEMDQDREDGQLQVWSTEKERVSWVTLLCLTFYCLLCTCTLAHLGTCAYEAQG